MGEDGSRRCDGEAYSVIPGMQTFRWRAEFVEKNERGVGKRRFPRAARDVFSWRRGDWWIEQDDAARAAEAFGKLEVFHEREVGEPAQRLEVRAPDEDRLIAIERAEGAVVPALERLEPAAVRMALIEGAIKRATDK